MQPTRAIFAFSHIPKTAGTTLTQILKRHFGHRHVAVQYRIPPPLYTRRDLSVDLKLHPKAESLAGHTLKPFVDFGKFDERLVWYTFLRHPIDRFVSHYHHQLTSGISKFDLPFREWMRTYHRRNWMVRMMAGEEDLEAAKQILLEKFRFVGLTERFDESLLVLRHRIGLPGMIVDYPIPSNISARNSVRRDIQDNMDEYYEDIVSQNYLDIELYDFATNVIWERQVSEYGLERLERDMESAFCRERYSLRDKSRFLSFAAYRNLIYKPYLWLDRRYLAQN